MVGSCQVDGLILDICAVKNKGSYPGETSQHIARKMWLTAEDRHSQQQFSWSVTGFSRPVNRTGSHQGHIRMNQNL